MPTLLSFVCLCENNSLGKSHVHSYFKKIAEVMLRLLKNKSMFKCGGILLVDVH